MSNNTQNDWREQVIFYCTVCIMISLFLPRSILSISLGVFIIMSFFHRRHRQQFRQFFASPFLMGITLLFFVPLISGLWSQDKQQWAEMMRIKLPLLFLPIAFAAPLNFSKKKWDQLAFIFLIVITIATGWSISRYLTDMSQIHEGYLRSKMITTPLEDDHVRFSWLVSIAIILAGWILIEKRKILSKFFYYLLLIVGAWLVIYLHLLAARTGLLCLYSMLFLLSIWFVFKTSQKKWGIAIIIFLLVLPLISWLIFPTFQNRLKYIMYDVSYINKAVYLPGSNDGRRYFSLKGGLELISIHPVRGVGFGDIRNEMNQWYKNNVPMILDNDRLYPSSQWVVYGVGCGVPGIIIFSIVMILPFFLQYHRRQIAWVLLNVCVFLSLIFDIGLEVQYGVFLYSFIVLWWWKWIQTVKMI